MTVRRLIAAALLAGIAVPASASVVVIGNSGARQCFLAADAGGSPDPSDIMTCDMALREEGLVLQDQVATHVNRGILRLRRGQIAAAIADFDAAIALDPRQPEAYLNKGAALMRVDNAREALPLFTASLERNTARPELAHFGRAIANETLGNVEAAYNDYRRASELRPNWEEPRAELRRFRVTQ